MNFSGRATVGRMDVTGARLRAQGLVGRGLGSPVDAIGRLGAVQAQHFEGAKWALAMRSGATDAEIDDLYDSGEIVRTHVLRPTWHFATAEDVGWLLELTGPRVRTGLKSRHRVLEVDPPTIARAESVFAEALAGGRHLTRRQLGEELVAAGIAIDGQRLAHLVLCGELDGLLVSGRRAGREHTYALLEERVPRRRALDGEAALAELATRYFTTHGPAQLADFVWWSGVTVSDARRAIALAGSALVGRSFDDREHWMAAAAEPAPADGVVRLLPAWDEYTVAYRDRRAVEPSVQYAPSFFSFQSILSPVVLGGGRVTGAWEWSRGDADAVRVRLLPGSEGVDEAALRQQADRLRAFRARPVALTVAG